MCEGAAKDRAIKNREESNTPLEQENQWSTHLVLLELKTPANWTTQLEKWDWDEWINGYEEDIAYTPVEFLHYITIRKGNDAHQ